MIYFNDKGVAVMGERGFIGSTLAKRDLRPGVYMFDAPSSIVNFRENTDICMKETLNDFIDVISFCKRTGTSLVFPSSSAIYSKATAYGRCKAAIEEIYHAYNYPALGLRIAAGYGPNEAHKRDYASVIYQWCKQMLKGERPVIFGDGTQTRDFIYQEDLVDNIIRLQEEGATGFHDVGTGINTSFNDVVKLINEVLVEEFGNEHLIEPIYVPRPPEYMQETIVKAVPCKVTLKEGIRNIIKTL